MSLQADEAFVVVRRVPCDVDQTQARPDRDATASAARVGVESLTLGPFATNCYVLWPEAWTGPGPAPCWVVDASFESQRLVRAVERRGLRPELIVLTHAHVDHIAGVDTLRHAWPGVPVAMHEAERDWLTDPVLNLSALGGVEVAASRGPDRFLVDGQSLTLGPTRWSVLHTPGHSPGGLTLWSEPAALALVGDTLFAGSVGRTDFPGSDAAVLARSIRERLYTLPGATRVLPGHGPETTIARERASNPFVRG